MTKDKNVERRRVGRRWNKRVTLNAIVSATTLKVAGDIFDKQLQDILRLQQSEH